MSLLKTFPVGGITSVHGSVADVPVPLERDGKARLFGGAGVGKAVLTGLGARNKMKRRFNKRSLAVSDSWFTL